MEAVVQDDGRKGIAGAKTGAGTVLCLLEEIPDPGGKGFVLPDRPRFFVIRLGNEVWGYVNSCPHQGVNLDWKPDSFLSYDRDVIQCATHGARFSIKTGLCLAGPCQDRSLARVEVHVADGAVVLA